MSRSRPKRHRDRSTNRRPDESSLERLLRDLEDGGTTFETPPDAAPGLYSMTAYQGEVLDPPVRFTVLERDLDAILEATQRRGSPQVVFPDRDPWTGSYFLFLANLDEEVARYDYKISALTVSPTGVRGTPRDDWDPHPFLPGITASDLGPPGDYRWTADRPRG